MFEAAAVGAILELEGVLAIGRATEERDRLVHHRLNSRDERHCVEGRRIREWPIHDAMGHSAFHETPLAEATNQDRRGHKRFGVRGEEQVTISRRAQAGRSRISTVHPDKSVLSTRSVYWMEGLTAGCGRAGAESASKSA